MADKEEFSFEEEENSEPGTGISYTKEKDPESTEDRRKGSRTRILFLNLLLIAAGAAGFYSFSETSGTTEAITSPPQVAVTKQPISVPPRPIEEISSKEKDPIVTAKESDPQNTVPETSKAVEENVLPDKSTEMIQVASEEQASPASPEEEPEPPVPAVQNQAADRPDAYVVAAGAFLLRSNLAEAEKKVYESGFVPHVVQKKKPMDMTRLRIGIFPLQEGRKKMEELAEVAPDVFCLPADDGVAVYAASFQNIDKARNFADRLYKEGLRVEEESARVEIPLYLLSFGGFTDLEAARKAAGQVQAAGLDTVVVKKP